METADGRPAVARDGGRASAPIAGRVLIACATPLVGEGVARVVDHMREATVAGMCGTVSDLFIKAHQCDPTIVIMDDALDPAFQTVRLVVEPRRAVIVLLAPTRRGQLRVREALKAGAGGAVSWASSRSVVADALRAARTGRVYVAPELQERHQESAGRAVSRREDEVLQLVCRGLDNRQVAERLFVSSETIKTHVRNIARKLGARDRAQIVVHAFRTGLVDERLVTEG
ncbi:response regulator transcription factor [Solihabitans fulvus]|uniref:Response regulator transcription factor n=1 Tax=Solihabitans fulvus TaxID=1892852 RepID=A0A5B2XHV6_9PSEU|nr:response regulator transcription factor [Solihabitans fulvus]KAA2262609.1 response regulator transcription factor [Solihabitans fulvus]